MKTVTATEYKHNALRLLEEVHRTGRAIRITKRGKAYAELAPLKEPPGKRWLPGLFADVATIEGDLIHIVDDSEWGRDAW